MYKLCGIKNMIAQLVQLSASYICEKPNKVDLMHAYRRFLQEAQPNVPKPESSGISLLSEDAKVAQLLEVFKEDSILDDFHEVFDNRLDENDNSISRIQDTLDKIKNIDESYFHLIELTIHTIFSAHSELAGGGSTSGAIGCIWVNARPHWIEQDLLEFLVHETTHNLVFIDELFNRHYMSYSEVAKEENFTESAILYKKRPLDKVFHSIIVSTEVLAFRDEFFGHPQKSYLHPPSTIMIDQTKSSINCLISNQKVLSLLTERSIFLLQLCNEKLNQIAHNSLHAA